MIDGVNPAQITIDLRTTEFVVHDLQGLFLAAPLNECLFVCCFIVLEVFKEKKCRTIEIPSCRPELSGPLSQGLLILRLT